MASVFHSRYFRCCLALFYLGTAIFIGCYSLLVLSAAFNKNGSPVGSTILVGIGLSLLVLSLLLFIFGFNRWRLARPNSESPESRPATP